MESTEQNYDSNTFLQKLAQQTKGHPLPSCPFCGGRKYTTLAEYGSILNGRSYKGLELGPTLPCGMVICTNCGHVDFFALGVLGLLPQSTKPTEGDKDGK